MRNQNSLTEFLDGRGEFLGMHPDRKLCYAFVQVAHPAVIDSLAKQDFVARLPIPGNHKDIFLARDTIIFPVDEEKLGVEFPDPVTA